MKESPVFFNIEKSGSPQKTHISLKYTHFINGIIYEELTMLLAPHQ